MTYCPIKEKKRNERRKDKKKLWDAAWQKANPEKCNVNTARYRRNNLQKHAAKEARNRATKLQAMPKWLTNYHLNKITEIYISCPTGYHVDHIIPLKGKNVRGLHVPWNLQHLPAVDNIKKGNRI